MSKIKSILLMGLSMVLVAALSIAGTVAYLKDEDSAVNVMTLGNVSIKQHEYERKVNADGTYATIETVRGTSYELVDFTQAKPLYPTTCELPSSLYYDDTKVYFAQLADGEVKPGDMHYYGYMDVFPAELTNVQDKFVFVENTGKTDAYVRTIIAFEAGSCDVAEWDSLIGTSANGYWTYTFLENTVSIDGNNYVIMVCDYTGANGANGRHPDGIVHPGDYTYNNLAQVYMKYTAENDDMVAIDGNNNGTYDILVLSQAVQAAGFSNAVTALNAGFGEANADNVKNWFEGESAASIPVVVDDADGLVEALESGKDVVLTDDVKIDPATMSNAYGTTGINVKNGQTIDGNGNTLDIKGAGGTWDSGINTTGGTIKNLTVTGSFRGVFINHNSNHSEPVILENVIIDGTTYTISCDQGMNQTLTATDSTFNGWTSFAATLGEATFIDCYFGEGNGNAFCRPYAPTTFVGCDFEKGYEVQAVAHVVFENCYYDGTLITADNIESLGILYNTDIANVTVK